MDPDGERPLGTSRRRILRACLAGSLLPLGVGNARADDQDWMKFKRRFVEQGERVVDTGNKNISHSESQGWGMLFAEKFDDKEAFQRLFDWTRTALQRVDGLFSWRWTPDASDHVADKNNASDGDILIAWALLRGARRWNEPRWAAQSKIIRTALLKRVVVEMDGRLILQPAVQGFQRGRQQVVNLSYYVWPAIRQFAQFPDERDQWVKLETDGLWLLDKASFGAHHLPPDWLLAGAGAFRIADGWPPRFGYDAVRIPLYLAWNREQRPVDRFIAAWQATKVEGRPPAWIDLNDGAVAPYVASEGYEAVGLVAQFAADGFKGEAPTMALNEKDDYYSASLKLLSAMAAREASTTR